MGGNFYDFLEGKIDYASVIPDPTDREKTKLMKVVSITRKPGGRVARIGFSLTYPKKRDIELEIDEPTARAIVKIFDDAPEKPEPGLTQEQEHEAEKTSGPAS